MAAICAFPVMSCSPGAGQTQSQESEEKSNAPLADFKPCSSLNEQQKKQLNITTPGETNELDDQSCDWKANGSDFGISVYSDKPLKEIKFSDAEEKNKTEVNNREALLVKNNTGSGMCSLAFAVTDSSSISVNSMADTPGDTETACDLVKKAAPMVEQNISDS
ncbi:DUF3558 family protein [Actinopolyspora alba]|uniref:DUF3558 family protein n=1 Tax=Actinopolyspora alba TaxID=673379 RepID=UPI001C31D529|nr:DUF3558 family protein [Actinopolyspora alba]